MKITKKKKVTLEKVCRIICDICGAAYDNKPESDDIYETQEFICIDRIGGFNSIFGDGEEIKVDICQHCFKNLIMDKRAPK
jgi:antitoxin CcdA